MTALDLTEFRDIKGPEAIESGAHSPPPGWLIVIAILAFVAIIAALIAWRRRRRQQHHHAVILRQLESIESELGDDSKRASVEIARSIRDYLSRTLSIPAFAFTADQIAQSMQHQAVNQQTIDATVTLLRRTDQAKFGGPDVAIGRSPRSLFDEARQTVCLISEIATNNDRSTRSEIGIDSET